MTEHPLSHGQSALWHMQRLLPDNIVYNVPLGLRILSDLDVAAVRRLCQLLVDRHPALRTTYSVRGREPVQIVHPRQVVRLRVVEAQDLSDEAVASVLADEAYRPFDLEQGPVMRATLLAREAGQHILLLVFHHIAIDLWSLTLLVEELGRLHAAVRAGTPPAPPPAATYLDFVRWQRTMLAGPKGQRLWDYWRRQFDGRAQPVALPVDFANRTDQATTGTAIPFRLNRELSAGIRRLAQDTRTTLNVVLLAAFEILLNRYSGQELLLLRTLTAGRSRAEFEPVIGFFANPVVLGADLSGDPSFAGLVGRVRTTVSAAIEHQDLPFELLIERLGLGRVTRFNPNPQAMFILQMPHRLLEEQRSQSGLADRGVFAAGPTGVRLDLGGLVVEKYNPPQRVTLNDLALEMVELGGELCGAFHYRTDLFRRETVARMASQYEQALVQACAEPGRAVSAFEFDPPIPPPRRRPADDPAAAISSAVIPVLPCPAAGATSPGPGRPATPEEEELARLFTEVLGGRAFGLHDNFFDSGGHSLLALQLIARVRDTFQVELPLRQLFDVPTVAGLADVLQRARRGSDSGRIVAVPREARDRMPLSFSQERLWFQDRLEHAPYVIPIALAVQGPLDAGALALSLDEVIARHEALRTTIEEREGEAGQVVGLAWRIEIPITTLLPHPGGGRDRLIARLAAEQAATPFELDRGPLLRARLLRFGADDHVLLLSLHHVVADGWSLGVLLREVSGAYQAIVSGGRPDLPGLPIQYADYAVWQRRAWADGRLRDQLAYWQDQLSGVSPLVLSADRPRPAIQSFRGASRTFRLDRQIVEALRRLGERQGTTLFMTLLAGFKALLCRYTGQADVVVGSPIAGRGRAELEGLIGCFLNVLALRTDLAGDPPFTEVLRRVREVCLGAYAHQDVPFEKIVEHLQPDRDLARQPIVQVMFVLQNAPIPPLRLTDEVTVVPLDVERRVTNYDLTVFAIEADDGIDGLVEYSPDLFDAETIDRMIRHLKRLLASAASDPSGRVSSLTLMEEDERRRVLHEWSGAEAAAPPRTSALALIEARATADPERIAVEAPGQVVTFGALDAWSSRLARAMAKRGVEPGAIVAIEVERSPALVALLLGAWKAGAAYVYLDPSHPRARRDEILAAADARLLVSECRGAAAAEQAALVHLERLLKEAVRQPRSRPQGGATPGQLAYVAFTSGSTGAPKGVMVPHEALANYLQWCTAAYEMEQGGGVPLFTSPAFDFAVTALVAPLVAGQRIVVLPASALARGAAALRGPQAWSVLKLTPAMGSALGEAGAGELPRARFVVFGGEQLAAGHAVAWSRFDPSATVVNEYGPTEATVGCCTFSARAGELEPGDVPIGRPIPGMRAYVLGPSLELVPVGVTGELFVAGSGLSWGYLNQPDLTVERFVPDPYALRAGERMYRTGDLARWREDGVLECLGRLDDQVKIRGFLVEPAEVERRMAGLPGVRRAAVVATDEPGGERRLAAFVVCDQDMFTGVRELRSALRQVLPDFMVPSSIALVDTLPVDAAGKLDRRALRSRRAEPPVPAEAGAEPAGDIQRAIAEVWAEALHVDRVAADADFFDLGGHSLAAVKAMARLSGRFGSAVSLLDLFQARTVAALAAVVSRRMDGADSPAPAPAAALVRLNDSVAAQAPLLYCIHPSGGTVECYRDLARALAQAAEVVGVQSRGVTRAGVEHDSLNEMAEEYARLIAGQSPGRPVRLLGWSFGARAAVHTAAALDRLGVEVGRLILLDPSRGRRPVAASASTRRRFGRTAEALEAALPAAGPWAVEAVSDLVRLAARHEAMLRGDSAPAVRCPVQVFLPSEGARSTRAQLVHAFGKRVEVETIEADHFSMLVGPAAVRIAQRLAR